MGALILANGEGGSGLKAASAAILNGLTPLDAVERGIKVVEADPLVRTVGYGGAPNLLGMMEFDASIMCGTTLRTGAVGALQNYLHAITVARQIMERLPHVMLVGHGAVRFAREMGHQETKLLSPDAAQEYATWLAQILPEEKRDLWPDMPIAEYLWPSATSDKAKGTTCFLVRSADGELAGGVSTSGWSYKYPGRLGDSPIIGAGLYVDNRFGAAACTHTGEMTIRASTARSVILYMKKGATVNEACHEALEDLRALKSGHLGPVVIHALDNEGTPYVLSTGNDGNVPYWLWTAEKGEIERKIPTYDG